MHECSNLSIDLAEKGMLQRLFNFRISRYRLLLGNSQALATLANQEEHYRPYSDASR